MKKTVAVMFGGCSPEYGVSLQSAAAVLRYMDKGRYEPVMVGKQNFIVSLSNLSQRLDFFREMGYSIPGPCRLFPPGARWARCVEIDCISRPKPYQTKGDICYEKICL